MDDAQLQADIAFFKRVAPPNLPKPNQDNEFLESTRNYVLSTEYYKSFDFPEGYFETKHLPHVKQLLKTGERVREDFKDATAEELLEALAETALDLARSKEWANQLTQIVQYDSYRLAQLAPTPMLMRSLYWHLADPDNE